MNVLRALVLVAAAALAGGCVLYKPVPMTTGAFPRGSVLVGDDIRVSTRDGETQRLRVAGVENGVVTTTDGTTLDPAEVTLLERKTYDKKATIITLSIIGGVIVTGLALDALDDCEDDPFCDYYY